VQDIAPDQTTGAYSYTRIAEDGSQSRVWIVTATTVRARLDLARTYGIGGMTINDMLDAGNDPSLLTAINEFKASSASTVPGQLVLQWTVSGAGGAVIDQTTGLGTPFVWQASEAGDYTIAGSVVGGGVVDRGSVAVRVADAPTEAPAAPTQAPTRAPNTTVTPAPNTTVTPTPRPTTAAAPPPAPSGAAGSDGGGLELGAQLPGSIMHTDKMQQAGMRWVKFQIKWAPGLDPGVAAGYVAAAHGSGYKVLLAIPGQPYPTAIDYNGYVEFLRGVAAYQPDAIEVWNEMNIDFEWPAGQINPQSYVNNMLAPSFNAIKSVSPGTMVIIGALAPTGYFGGCTGAGCDDNLYVQGMAAAGAANYANCIGVHHNAGTAAPSVQSGLSLGGHYSWYFQPTLNVYYNGMGGRLPVCLTEYGYVSPEGVGPLPSNFSWGNNTTVAQQAAWLAEGETLARSLGWVRLMIIWNIGFTTSTPDPQAQYSIVRPDGSCPACVALGSN
ncbi:MAG: hypothetical protein IT326_00115, partial [Anaerolineae bacterium]|nr:hypothetical protein [Anaerolineae bacterium]